MAKPKTIVVIGAGILGAATAWFLSKRGANVVVCEAASSPGGVATQASFSWINAGFGNQPPYFDLRMHAIKGWRDLAEQFPASSIRFCGSLFHELQGEALAGFVKQHRKLGYAIKLVERTEIARLEPCLAEIPEMAAFAPNEAMVDAHGFAKMLLKASRADMCLGQGIKSVLCSNGRVNGVATRAGEIAADGVVVAAGSATPDILASLGINFEINSPAGLLVTTNIFGKKLNHLNLGPETHVRQLQDGRLLAGADFVGAFDRIEPENSAKALVNKLQDLFGAPQLVPENHAIGFRPTPLDGFPAIGPVPGFAGLYVVVSHSGVTLAPAIGEMAADEILYGERHPLLASYRFDRFANTPPS